MSALENRLLNQIMILKLPTPIREFRFGAMAAGGPGKGLRERLRQAGLKDWRFDLAWPELRLAVEVEGGLHVGGRHNRGKGYEEDLKKYSEAMRLGWTVYRCGSKLIDTGDAISVIEKLLEEA